MMNFLRIKTKMNSLRLKFAVLAVLISLVSFGLAAYFANRWMAQEIEDEYKEKAALIGTHIIHDLGMAIAAQDHGGIVEILNLYRGHKNVEEARVFDLKGEEKFFREKGLTEPRVEEVLRGGNPIHFHKEINKRKVGVFLFPIKNEPVCQQCHGKSEALRGALLFSLNWEQLEHYIGQQQQKLFLFFTVISLGIIVATIIAVRRLFLQPLLQLQKGAEAIEKGDLQHQIPIKSKDEIGTLGHTFNRMAQTLLNKSQELIEQLRLVSRSQKEWQETFDCIKEPIAVMDRDCRILRANWAFREIFSETWADVIHKRCSDLYGSCWWEDCPQKASLQERRPTSAEIRGPKTGKIFEVSVFPYDSSKGDFGGSVLIAKDVTEKKENELRQIMTERLAALGQIASGLSHEINNPLATISVSVEGLLKRVGEGRFDPQLFRNYLSIIWEESQRIRGISRSMLSFATKRGNEKKEVNIHELLDKTVETVSLQGRFKEIEVLRNYREDLPCILTHEGELRQVFLTIINNALDAMEERGRLTLETGTEDNSVFIKISDIGPGIPRGIRERIFTPFFTTKSEKGGTGLGLSIAYKIIEENKGKIELTSEEGKGTTFKITLPLIVNVTSLSN